MHFVDDVNVVVGQQQVSVVVLESGQDCRIFTDHEAAQRLLQALRRNGTRCNLFLRSIENA